MGTLFANAIKLMIVVPLMGVMVLINYMMNEKAVQLFFENWRVLTDRLVGPFFRQLGWGEATLSQLWALMIAVTSALGVTFPVHQATSRSVRNHNAASLLILESGSQPTDSQ